MMPVDLRGLHVLITRPIAQAKPWASALEALGASTTVMPTLGISAIDDTNGTQAITDQLLRLDEYQKAIFVSQNAVDYGIEWIDQFWPQLPLALSFFAIGQTTASHLAGKLRYLDAAIQSPEHAMNSEALLALDDLQDINGEKIIIFRGQGGRTHLGKTLEARGALVDYCEVYKRVIPNKTNLEQLTPLIHRAGLTIIITAHSGETLENLCELANEEQRIWLQQQILLIPGERVAEIATQRGFKKQIIAENATHESMIEALNDWRQHS